MFSGIMRISIRENCKLQCYPVAGFSNAQVQTSFRKMGFGELEKAKADLSKGWTFGLPITKQGSLNAHKFSTLRILVEIPPNKQVVGVPSTSPSYVLGPSPFKYSLFDPILLEILRNSITRKQMSPYSEFTNNHVCCT